MKWTQRAVIAFTIGLLPSGGLSLHAAEEQAGAAPVPTETRRELREMSTDRPDATEGPSTVDAGHVQVEMDVVNHTTNRLFGVRTKTWGVAAFNVRFGLRDDLEFGVFVAPYTRTTEEPRGGPRETSSGFGDVTLRGKLNFWGNDGGASALGLIADLKLPTAARGLGNDSVEGTVLLPLGLELGRGRELGAMTGVDIRLRDSGSGRRGVWINTVTVGHGITENLAGYVEITSETGAGPQVATFNAGLTLKINANTQLDVGCELGLSRQADDAVVFVGLARRY